MIWLHIGGNPIGDFMYFFCGPNNKRIPFSSINGKKIDALNVAFLAKLCTCYLKDSALKRVVFVFLLKIIIFFGLDL